MEAEQEMELENERQRAEDERDQLVQRLQEVEHDMEEYSRTAEELRAMLEEEEEEGACMQALENLEFCNYTLEALAREQQQLQLQGKTTKFSSGNNENVKHNLNNQDVTIKCYAFGPKMHITAK